MDDASRPPRVFVAGPMHESNSFSPFPTSLRNFADDCCYRPPDPAGREQALSFPDYGDAIAVARARGAEVITGPCFWTQPSGPCSAATYREFRDAVAERLAAAGGWTWSCSPFTGR